MMEPLWLLVGSLLGTDDLLGGHFSESSSYILALQEPHWHCPSGGERCGQQHTGRGWGVHALWFISGSQMRPFRLSLQTPVATSWWPCSPSAARARSGASSSLARSTRWPSRSTACSQENTKVRPARGTGGPHSLPVLPDGCSETQLRNFTPTLHLYLFNSSLPLDLECA